MSLLSDLLSISYLNNKKYQYLNTFSFLLRTKVEEMMDNYEQNFKMKKLYNEKKDSFFGEKERIFQEIDSLDEQIATEQNDFDQLKIQTQFLNAKITTNDQEQTENRKKIETLNCNLELEIQLSNAKHIELFKQKSRLQSLKSRNMLKLNSTTSNFNAVKKEKKTFRFKLTKAKVMYKNVKVIYKNKSKQLNAMKISLVKYRDRDVFYSKQLYKIDQQMEDLQTSTKSFHEKRKDIENDLNKYEEEKQILTDEQSKNRSDLSIKVGCLGAVASSLIDHQTKKITNLKEFGQLCQNKLDLIHS